MPMHICAVLATSYQFITHHLLFLFCKTVPTQHMADSSTHLEVGSCCNADKLI